MRIEDDKVVLQPVPNKVEDAFGLISDTRSVSLNEMEEIIKNHSGRTLRSSMARRPPFSSAVYPNTSRQIFSLSIQK